MDFTLDKDENAKNIYVIRHKLGNLKPCQGNTGRWEYGVKPFNVVIFAYGAGDTPPSQADNLLRFEKVDVVLNEFTKDGTASSVRLNDDPRFKDYEPIQYNVIETPSGRINLSNGDKMPILHLCELIRYLHRLSNLTAFM
jgi:hypothetical protein